MNLQELINKNKLEEIGQTPRFAGRAEKCFKEGQIN